MTATSRSLRRGPTLPADLDERRAGAGQGRRPAAEGSRHGLGRIELGGAGSGAGPRLRRLVVAGLVVGLPAVAAALQVASLDRVADGGFEAGAVSLTVPSAARMPLFGNGWAFRGTPAPQVLDAPGAALEGHRALQVRSIGRPVQLAQDLPVTSTALMLRAGFLIESGSQTVRLLSDWDRALPGRGRAALEVTLSERGLEVVTEAGRWEVARSLETSTWHLLEAAFDPRLGAVTISLDGAAILSLPGVPSRPPTTLLLEAAAGRSSFRYDGLALVQLTDLELAAVDELAAMLPAVETAGRLAPRLEAARLALARGAPALAVPEVRAALRQMDDGTETAVRLRGALVGLLDLLEADLDRQRTR